MTDKITINRIGYYTALITAGLTLVTFVIAFFTPPMSGPGCTEGCFEYPYAGIASRYPRDYYWMYPAMILMLVYLFLTVCIHYFVKAEKKIFSLMGVMTALISASVLIADYFLQLSVIQPSVTRGETDGIALLTQFNPHGVFIGLEEMAYFVMSVSFLFIAFAFAGDNRLEKWLRTVLISGFLIMVISLIAFSFTFGIDREYRFELAAISIDWLVLIIGGILLSRLFRRNY